MIEKSSYNLQHKLFLTPLLARGTDGEGLVSEVSSAFNEVIEDSINEGKRLLRVESHVVDGNLRLRAEGVSLDTPDNIIRLFLDRGSKEEAP